MELLGVTHGRTGGSRLFTVLLAALLLCCCVLSHQASHLGIQYFIRTHYTVYIFRKAEWDNYLRHGPRAQAEYHHGFEHCI
jgi:hypothetical protein